MSAALVVLNGPSSAGKTTLATALRDRLGADAMAVSLDRFFPMASSARRNDWSLFAALFDAMLATAVAFADRGFVTIVDTVFERAVCLERVREHFGTRTYHLVAITCPVEILEERERARGNRRVGQAREQRDRVWHDAEYEIELDTHVTTTDDCVARIVERFGLAA